MASEFDRLREVAKVLAKYHSGKAAHIDFDNPRDLYSRLSVALLDPSISHPLQIPEFAEAKSDSFVSSVQTQTKERLYNMMFNLRLTEASKVRTSSYQNHKDLFLVNVFTLLGLRSSATRLATSGLKDARRLGLTMNCLHFLRILRADAAQRGDRKAHASYAESQRQMLDQYHAESEANILAEELITTLAATGQDSKEAKILASRTLRRLDFFFKQRPSFITGITYYRTAAINAELKHDFRLCLRICDEALRFLQAHDSSISPSHRGEFLLRRLEASLHLGTLDRVETDLEEALALFSPTSINWFVVKHYQFLCMMKTGKFDQAGEVVNSVKGNVRFSMLNDDRQARWKLYDLYARILSGSIRSTQSAGALDELRILIHTLGGYKVDKEGFNVVLLILENILLLDLGRMDEFSDGHDKLRVYRNRHLKSGTRPHAILDLLCHVSKHYDGNKQLTLPDFFEDSEVEHPLLVSYPLIRKHLEYSLMHLGPNRAIAQK